MPTGYPAPRSAGSRSGSPGKPPWARPHPLPEALRTAHGEPQPCSGPHSWGLFREHSMGTPL